MVRMSIVPVVVRRHSVIMLLLSGSGGLGLRMLVSAWMMLLLMMALRLMEPSRFSLGVLMLV